MPEICPALGVEFAAAIDSTEIVPDSADFGWTASEEFLLTDYRREWLVEGLIVKNEPCVLGGPKKTLKSSICIDLAVSLAAWQPFLGHFFPGGRFRVGVINGESGQATLQQTLRRVCLGKDTSLQRVFENLFWGFKLPRLDDPYELQQFGKQLEEQRLDVVIIDPLYLCLLGSGGGQNASSLFDMGPLLLAAATTCLEAGATPIFVHHSTKSSGQQRRPLDLEDLAFAGIQEFARQWILLSRLENYTAGSGQHRLVLTAGGSAGHSGCWVVEVDEGQLQSDFSGRQWVTQVRTYAEAMQLREAQGTVDRQQRDQVEEQRILTALRSFPNGETFSAIREESKVDRQRARSILEELVETEQVQEVNDIMKPAGNSGLRSYKGYRLVECNTEDPSPEEPEDQDDVASSNDEEV